MVLVTNPRACFPQTRERFFEGEEEEDEDVAMRPIKQHHHKSANENNAAADNGDEGFRFRNAAFNKASNGNNSEANNEGDSTTNAEEGLAMASASAAKSVPLSLAIRIDEACRVLFPLNFLCFNIFYWFYYLYY